MVIFDLKKILLTKLQKKNYDNWIYAGVSISIFLFIAILASSGYIILSKFISKSSENLKIAIEFSEDSGEDDIISNIRLLRSKSYYKPQSLERFTPDSIANSYRPHLQDSLADYFSLPFRNVIFFEIQHSHEIDKTKLMLIKSEWLKKEGIEDVYYRMNDFNQIKKNLNKIYLLLIIFISFLVIITVVFLSNTIRAVIYEQRKVIYQKSLIGASIGNICLPYVKNAAIMGLFAILLSFSGIFLVYKFLGPWISIVEYLERFEIIGLIVLFICFELIIIIFTFYAVRKSLLESITIYNYGQK